VYCVFEESCLVCTADAIKNNIICFQTRTCAITLADQFGHVKSRHGFVLNFRRIALRSYRIWRIYVGHDDIMTIHVRRPFQYSDVDSKKNIDVLLRHRSSETICWRGRRGREKSTSLRGSRDGCDRVPVVVMGSWCRWRLKWDGRVIRRRSRLVFP